MVEEKSQPSTVDEYIAQFPADVQQILARIRALIKETAPEAEEKISYDIPGYFLNGRLVWFAAWKKHIAFYPKSAGMLAQIKELAGYKGTKGSVHFPLDKPMPYELIRRMVKVRIEENRENPD